MSWMRELLARMELEVLVAWVTDVVWVKLLLRLLTIAEVAVEDTAAASQHRPEAGCSSGCDAWPVGRGV